MPRPWCTTLQRASSKNEEAHPHLLRCRCPETASHRVLLFHRRGSAGATTVCPFSRPRAPTSTWATTRCRGTRTVRSARTCAGCSTSGGLLGIVSNSTLPRRRLRRHSRLVAPLRAGPARRDWTACRSRSLRLSRKTRPATRDRGGTTWKRVPPRSWSGWRRRIQSCERHSSRLVPRSQPAFRDGASLRRCHQTRTTACARTS